MNVDLSVTAATRGSRVLVIDDDPTMRLLCSLNLQCQGLVVLEAEDGREGLERARTERPDLIVTDVRMPRLDGFELAEELRRDARTRTIPIIFHTGEVEPASEQRAVALGAVAYLTKPFDLTALASLVVGALPQT
jgi:CheY-like chemotaxis protein